MNINDKVLALDLLNLSEADKQWLHDMKNAATRLSFALDLKRMELEQQGAIQ